MSVLHFPSMNTTNLTIKILWVDMTGTFNFHATSTRHKLIMYNVTRGDWFKTRPGINCANTTKSLLYPLIPSYEQQLLHPTVNGVMWLFIPALDACLGCQIPYIFNDMWLTGTYPCLPLPASYQAAPPATEMTTSIPPVRKPFSYLKRYKVKYPQLIRENFIGLQIIVVDKISFI